jgi:hypothetical protein
VWTYKIKQGELWEGDVVQATGLYSGDSEHFNDPASTALVRRGPIPVGVYWIGVARDTKEHGPVFIPLHPVPGSQMYGRSDFGMHGDEIDHVGEHLASKGCIIAGPATRDRVKLDVGGLLTVLSGEGP